MSAFNLVRKVRVELTKLLILSQATLPVCPLAHYCREPGFEPCPDASQTSMLSANTNSRVYHEEGSGSFTRTFVFAKYIYHILSSGERDSNPRACDSKSHEINLTPLPPVIVFMSGFEPETF